MVERWAPVEGFEGLYEVSDAGRVRSLDRRVPHGGHTKLMRSRVLKPRPTRNGYLRVSLSSRGKTTDAYIHRLVACAFLGHPAEGVEVCHGNGNRVDNRLENLRWDTHGENVRDTVRHGNHAMTNRTNCPLGHPLKVPNLSRSGKGRHCLACHRASAYFRVDEPEFAAEANRQYQRIANGAKVRYIRPYTKRSARAVHDSNPAPYESETAA